MHDERSSDTSCRNEADFLQILTWTNVESSLSKRYGIFVAVCKDRSRKFFFR